MAVLRLLPLVVPFLAATAVADGGRSCPTSCGAIDISYPFGVGPACSRPGFNLTCDATTYSNDLRLGSPNATVDYMITSASGSVTSVAVHVVRSVSMPAGAGTYSASWEGPGRPFAISGSSNMPRPSVGTSATAPRASSATPTSSTAAYQTRVILSNLHPCLASLFESLATWGVIV